MLRFAALVTTRLAFLFVVIGAAAQTAQVQSLQNINPWLASNAVPAASPQPEPWIQPTRFFAISLDHAQLAAILQGVPQEAVQPAASSPSLIALPMPDGSLARFTIAESPVMAPELGAKFPAIRTYLGRGIDDPRATLRFDVTPAGFHAQILSPRGAVYIDPQFRGDTNHYTSYYKRDYLELTNEFHCDTVDAGVTAQAKPQGIPFGLMSGGSLRTYRLAVAATAEYTRFQGGTIPDALAAIVTAVNRVTGVYETELAIRLSLIANEDQIIYTSTNNEPYDNFSGLTMLSQNQSNLDYIIGDANYDIGHVFSTGAGGIAGVGVVCMSGEKAWGATGLSHPTGDPFYIDYVAHEMGHEFGAHHPFNGVAGNCSGASRYPPTAYEPGSGSTIMAYAGICGSDNLQPHSDPYFHSISLEEIINYTTAGLGNGCAATTITSNEDPTVTTGTNYNIPSGTPFTLTAVGSDPDGDPITYCWEERDLGPAEPLGAPDNGSSPLFRSFSPTTNSSRTFPQWSNIIYGTNSPSEEMPVTSRTMNFRVTVRDNRTDGGAVFSADTEVTAISNGGPFSVTFPAGGENFAGVQNVMWNIGVTANPPINAQFVNILLSTNGGQTFPIVLATNVPNNGAATIVTPNISTYNGRMEVQPVGNIFFAVDAGNFAILPISVVSAALTAEDCLPTNGVIDPGETVTVAFALADEGGVATTNLVATLLSTNGVIPLSGPQTYGALDAFGDPVTNSFAFIANGNCGDTITAVLRLQDGPTDLGIATQSFTLGTPTSVTRTFGNLGAIQIPATGTGGTNPQAAPYPSSVTVSGVSGAVTKATVTLSNLSHSFPDDVSVLLVGPGGTNVLLMSHAGGGIPVANLELTFDDAGSSGLPETGPLTSGVWQPSAYGELPVTFPGAVPPPPYGQTLSVFNGMSPNGTWLLYVQDTGEGNTGQIAQGWSLALTTASYACCSGAANQGDLAVSESAAQPEISLGSNVTFVINVTNLGPGVAAGIVVTDALPVGLTFVYADASQGSWTNDNGVATCALGALSSGGAASCRITANASVAGIFKNSISVGAATLDPVSANNLAAATVSVMAFPTISYIPDQMTTEGAATAPAGFTIGAAPASPGSLIVSGVSGDTNLVPNQNIVFGGVGSNRTVTISPAANSSGQTTIIVSVSSGPSVSTQSFALTVVPVPPVLAPIPDATIHAGSTLGVTNSVTDPNAPPAILTFSLDPGYPPGATVAPATGVFLWTPGDSQANTTNDITMRVTDNGHPNLSAAQTFAVTVVPRMSILSITDSSNAVTIVWSAIAGDTYRVQFKDSLNQTTWSNLPPDVTATDVTASNADPSAAGKSRFYRVLLVEP